MYKPKIGITIGDFNGIGLETIIKTFQDSRMLAMCTPVIFASSQLMESYSAALGIDLFPFVVSKNPKNINSHKANIIQSWEEDIAVSFGEKNKEAGKYAAISIIEACKAVRSKSIDGIVTAPIEKSSLIINGVAYKGHTDLFRSLFKTPAALMIMVANELRIALLTEHIPIAEVSNYVHKNKIIQTLKVFEKSLIEDFNIPKPRIAVLGLNPHNGDDGLIGKEEEAHIIPAIVEAREKENILAFGPYSADGFMGFGKQHIFDGVLAMYHDQGLIPFKMQYGNIGVNFTAALPFLRTSPDHGTAMDIAGKNQADPQSFRHAVYALIDAVRNRKDLEEMNANPLQKHTLKLEKEQ